MAEGGRKGEQKRYLDREALLAGKVMTGSTPRYMEPARGHWHQMWSGRHQLDKTGSV